MMKQNDLDEMNIKWDHLYHGYIVRKSYTLIMGLTGAELLVYALVHSYSENNDYRGIFCGSLEYIADMTAYSISSVRRAIKSLVEKKYIFKKAAGAHRRTMSLRANFKMEEQMINRYISEVERLCCEGKVFSEFDPYGIEDIGSHSPYSIPTEFFTPEHDCD